ncbi:MAG: sulfotransferase domain-containing protein [Phycisphaerae bacterium]
MFGVLRKLAGRLRGNELRTDPRDVFVVSYPRSGNTWVRFLLANLLRARDGKPVDFYTLPLYVPDLHIEEHRDIVRRMEPPRLLKTHDLPAGYMRRVIYLLRDGRDVAVSHYVYLKSLGRFDGSFMEYLESPRGPRRWARHVSEWLDARDDRALLVVRYEDLKSETAGQLRRMAQFAGLPADTEDIERAVERSNFESMRKLQDTNGRPYSNSGQLQQVRKGTAGQWRDWFDDAHIEVFNRCAGDVLRKLGYEDNAGS